MIPKEITLPKALHELHGETTRISALVMAYLAGLIVAGVTVCAVLPAGLPVWKVLLVGFLYLDMAAGMVANLSTYTNQYYQRKPRLRTGFILLHCLHPALFGLVLPAGWPFFVFVGAFTLGAAG